MYRSKHWSGTIPIEQNSSPWKSEDDIKFLVHFTDIHISPLLPKAFARFNHSLKAVHSIIKPNLVVITGDIADNYDVIEPPGRSFQHEEHWNLYSQIRGSYYNDNYLISPDFSDPNRYVEILGNHDAYGIADFNNDSLPHKFLLHKYETFFSWSHEKDGIRVISFQPFLFPTGHGPQLFIPPITPEMLDDLENELSKETTARYTLVGVHFPFDLMWPDSSSHKTGRSFVKIIKDSKINAMLAGHTHPHNIEALHLEKYNTIEYVGTPTRTHEGFSIVSFDNGRIKSTEVYPKDEDPMIIVTCPTPDRYSPNIMTYKDFEIRIVVFSDKEMKFTVTGDIEAIITKDNRKKLQEGRYLYSYPVHLEKGYHTIKITSNDDRKFEEEIGFSIDQENKGFYEDHSLDLVDWSAVLILILSTLYILFLLVASFIPKSLYDKRESFVETDHFLTETNSNSNSNSEDENENENEKGNCKVWTVAVAGGPLMIGYRLSKLPIWCRIICVVVALWGWVFPISFYKTDGLISVIFFYGFITDGKAMFDLFSFLFTGFYIFTTAFWYISMFCAYSGKMNWSLIVDFLLMIALIVASSIFWSIYGFDVSTDGAWASSFTYFIFPLIGVIMFVVLFVLKIFLKKDIMGSKTQNETHSDKEVELAPVGDDDDDDQEKSSSSV